MNKSSAGPVKLTSRETLAQAAGTADERLQSTTRALLKDAYDQIEAAERRIADYEKRIRALEDLASTDPLTGLMNRRGFEKFYAHEIARIRRHYSPGALFVLIDLDRFKPLNDVYGHQAGDACLKMVANLLLKSVRIVDGAARFGGDEFALLLTQTDPQKAEVRVRQVRDMLGDMNFEWQGHSLRFGASLGCEPVSGESDYARAYQQADHALYADKKARKGRGNITA